MLNTHYFAHATTDQEVGGGQSGVGDTHRLNIALACSACSTVRKRILANGAAPCSADQPTTMSKEQCPTFKCQGMVELVGFEPTASCLQSRCSTN